MTETQSLSYRFLVSILIVLSFVVSPNLLFAIGVNYASAGGNPVEKFHIATILAACVLLLLLLRGGRIYTGLLRRGELAYCLACCIIILGYTLSRGEGSISDIVVTFITPIMFLVLVGNANDRDQLFFSKLIMFLVLANAIWGIAEYAIDFRPLPRVAGTTVYTGDARSFGFLGHPLTSSLLTGLTLIFLVISMLSARITLRRLALILILALALVFFGGRTSLALTSALLLIYLVFDGRRAYFQVRRKTPFVLRATIILLLIVAAAVVLATGGADAILERLSDDEGSAATRSSSLVALSYLTPSQWMLGLSSGDEAALSAALGVPLVVEITWVAWLLKYGLVGAALLGSLLWVVLRASTRGGQVYHQYMVVFFLVAVTGFFGLGGKTLLLAWFVCLCMAFGAPRSGSASRQRGGAMLGHVPEITPAGTAV